MRKLLIILFSVLSLTMFADDVIMPDWFLHPSTHTFVGISEPNGNVHDAINMALIHYLICSDFLGKIRMNSITEDSKSSTEYYSKTMFKLDTILHYAIEDIISVSSNEYICRISDQPNLSRRIIIQYYDDFHSLITDDQDDTNFNISVDFFYEDHNGKSVKNILMKNVSQNDDVTEYSYSSEYFQDDVFTIKYHNVDNKKALGEQLIMQYMHHLINGFVPRKEGEDNDYHKATPFSGFEYTQGQITIIP